MPDHFQPRHCMIVFNQYPLGETRVQREAEALLRAGYEVDVICRRFDSQPEVDSYKGVRIFRRNSQFRLPLVSKSSIVQRFFQYFLFFFSAFFCVNRLHYRNPYTSIQVHNLPDFLVFCAFIQKIQRVPIILDLHDLMPEFYSGRHSKSNPMIIKMVVWQERLSCQFADHIITVSDHWRQALIHRGVPAEKCSVMMNVADNLIFHPLEANTRVIQNKNSFRIVYHGSMVYRYGLDLAIEAVARLIEQIPGLHLSLIGQGEFVPEIIKLIDHLNLQGYVSLQPKRQAEELPEIIQKCDLGIVPYRNDVFTDGLLPTKLMEYAALGIPAIASRTTAIVAYFSGTNVDFFEPGDIDDLVSHILSLYQSPAKRVKLSENSKIFTDRYSWNRISSEYTALVNGLASRQESYHPVEKRQYTRTK